MTRQHPSRSDRMPPSTADKTTMKAIVITDQAAGTAGMKLTERLEPAAAINDVIVQIHGSGIVSTELEWPSTWTDRRDRDRRPSIPGHELAGVVTALGYGTTGLSVGQRVFGLADWYRDGTLAEYIAVEARNLAPLPGDVDFTVGASCRSSGPHRVAGTVPARPSSGGAERPRARRGRRSRFDGDAARTDPPHRPVPVSDDPLAPVRKCDAGMLRHEGVRLHPHDYGQHPPRSLARDLRQWIIDQSTWRNGTTVVVFSMAYRSFGRFWRSSQPPRYAAFSHPHHPFPRIAPTGAERATACNRTGRPADAPPGDRNGNAPGLGPHPS